MPVTPDSPLTALRGIGPQRAQRLQEAGFRTVAGLLRHLPHRYEDRRRITPAAALSASGSASLVGRLEGLRRVWTRRRGAARVRGLLRDGSGEVPVVWVNRPNHVAQIDETKE